MKKLIALIMILIVGLMVVTGCSTTTDNSDTIQPPALPDEKMDKSAESLEDNTLQPPELPEE
ncbi:MAG: hypothetical protein CMH61_00880 [Nanoarchaeota archaeon]|nr:hypothetical protein [Nanoarchaeota archaeon]|tara:strand:- start:1494 stop:1679 length:186 start_codon:yes stop_codon:yes gene_type:complete